MMTLTLTNLPEFRAAMTKYMQVVPRELSHALNWKSLAIVKDAQRNSPLATRENIEKTLGFTGWTMRAAKSGKRKGQMVVRDKILFSPDSLAIRLSIKWLVKHSQKPTREAVRAGARRILMARIKSIGTTKAGWNLPLRMLAAAVKGETFDPNYRGNRKRVKLQGWSRPAQRRSWKPVVDVSYDVLGKSKNAHEGEKVFVKMYSIVDAALKAEARKTLEYIARRLNRVNQQFIGRWGSHYDRG